MTRRSTQNVKSEERNGVSANVLDDKALFLIIHFHIFGVDRKVDPNEVETEVDRDRLHITKKLLDSPQHQDIKRFDTAVTRWLDTLCFPYDQAMKVVPLGLVGKVNAKLVQAKAERAVLIEKFVDAYPQLRSEAEKPLGKLYDKNEYPTPETVRARFTMKWEYITFAIPPGLAKVDPELAKQERAAFKAKMQETMDEIRDALRVGLLELVSRLRASLEPDIKTGKPKTLTTSSVDKLKDFLELLPDRNISNDSELDQIAAEVKAIMNGCSRDKLKESETLRDQVKACMVGACAKLQILTPGIRKFRTDEAA
jgi:hypothetical protein